MRELKGLAQTMTNDLQEKEKTTETKPKASRGLSKLRSLPSSFKKKSKKTRRLIIFIAVVVILVAAYLISGGMKKKTAGPTTTYTNVNVERRNITKTLSGSGTLQPANSYTVTTLVEGEILSSDIKEGDVVKKDDVLYRIDSSDMQTTIDRAKISLSNAQRSYQAKVDSMDNLNVKPSSAGIVTNIAVEVGDEIKAGQTVATVIDTENLTVILPFPADDAANFYVGQEASVTIDGSFEKLQGRVTKVSGADTVLTGNILVRKVTIEVTNPGALSESIYATATVGGAACSGSAKFTYKNNETLVATVAGTVTSINASEGNRVAKKQTIVTLSSTNMSNDLQNAKNSLSDAELTLQNANKKMDNYIIKSPIDGTIVQKTSKQGDKIQTAAKLCIVYDLSYLTITMSVDELDITQVKVGQAATITADAVSGKSFKGSVTKVSSVGATTNGVTTYPVTIRIDDFAGLMPSMNVSAKLLVAKSDNVLAVPVSSVQRGGRILVKQSGDVQSTDSKIPAGFAYVNIKTGISDGSFIEVKEGLKEGDVIAYTKTVITGTTAFGTPAQGAPQGGAPSGAQGGAPAGGQTSSSSSTTGAR